LSNWCARAYSPILCLLTPPSLSSQIDDFNLVSFLPLDITEEDSIGAILSHIDNALQYGEDEEVKPPKVSAL